MTKFARDFVQPKSLGQAFQGVSEWKFPPVLQTQGSTKLPRLIHDSSRETYQTTRPKNAPMQIQGALSNLDCYFCNRTFLQASPKVFSTTTFTSNHRSAKPPHGWYCLTQLIELPNQDGRSQSPVWVQAIFGFREIRIERKPWNCVSVSTV